MSPAAIFEVYTQAVCACLKERSLRPSVRAELQDHLEEKAQALQNIGLEGEEAARRAVRAMGPARELGERLALAYRPVPLAGYGTMLLLYAFCGFMASCCVTFALRGKSSAGSLLPMAHALTVSQMAVRGSICLAGLGLVLGIAYFLNYGLLLRRARLACLFCAALAAAIMWLSTRPGSVAVSLAHWWFPFGYFVLCLASAYFHERRAAFFLLWGGGLALCVLGLLFGRNPAVTTLFLLVLCIVSLMGLSRGHFAFSFRRLAVPVAALVTAFCFWAVSALFSSAAPSSYWEPGYGNSLARELTGYVQFRGSAEFSEAEYQRLIRARYELQEGNMGANSPLAAGYRAERDRLLAAPVSERLENLMPPDFQQEYLFLYLALRWGAVYAILPAAAMGAALCFLLRRAAAGRQLVAFLLGTGYAAFLLMQFALYCLANLGAAPGIGCGLPFVSWGRASLTANLFEACVLFSCLRFDLSIDESFYCSISV